MTEPTRPQDDPQPVRRPDDDHARFLKLYTRHQRDVSAFVAALLSDWSDVDEVMQETSLVLWSKFDQFEPGSSFPKWACAIAYRMAMRVRRRRGRDRHQFGAAFEDIAEAGASAADALEDRRRLLAGCVGKLPPGDHELLTACYAERATIKGVAEAMHRPAKGVYKALARIRKALFDCVENALRAEGVGG